MRELTEPAPEGETAPPPTLKVGETLVAAVRELIEAGRQKMATDIFMKAFDNQRGLSEEKFYG